jgi:hypothetical protein
MRKIIPKQDEFSSPSTVRGPLKKEKSKPIYPTVRMDLQHLPEAKDMKLGDMAHIGMHAKLTGLNQGRFDHSAEFEIHAISHKKLHKGDAGAAGDKGENAAEDGQNI